MREKRPLVSVIMGAFNCAHTIDEAIQSLVEQTYPNWELIVCDDASSDGTLEALLLWQTRDPDRIRVLQNSENLKLPRTLNKCLTEVRGEYVARMDGDDVATPTRLGKQVAFLLSHPEIDLVGSWMQRFDDFRDGDIVRSPLAPDRNTLRAQVPFCHATIMTRRAVYEDLTGYSLHPRVERVEDIDLWYRFFEAGFVGANIEEPLYRVREDMAAIRRRTFSARLNLLRTHFRGHRLLGYPLVASVRPLIEFCKVLVPARLILVLRSAQKGLQRSPGNDNDAR
ncbi:glycosyltransferase [Nocardioides gilvus]|uniref:glycosyltransferase family 2 protein n=1 Tax=Nocardioides gilvus TaxID=1735589 RepID=UPI000D74EE50